MAIPPVDLANRAGLVMDHVMAVAREVRELDLEYRVLDVDRLAVDDLGPARDPAEVLQEIRVRLDSVTYALRSVAERLAFATDPMSRLREL